MAVIGLDDSYGRNGILALERESYNRETFYNAFNEFILRLDYRGNMEQIANRSLLESKSTVQ